MERIRWRRDEAETLMEPAGAFVVGVDRQGADARDVGGLEHPHQRIVHQARTTALPLRCAAEREPGQQYADENGNAISFARPPTPPSSVQPVLDSQAWHSFEIGSVGGQEKCVIDQRCRGDFQIP